MTEFHLGTFINAIIYALDTLRWTQEQGIDLFYFSAFDEDWKAGT